MESKKANPFKIVKFKHTTVDDFRVGVRWIKLVIRSANPPKKNALSVKERAHTTKDGSFKRVLYFGWPKQPPSGGVSKTINRVTE